MTPTTQLNRPVTVAFVWLYFSVMILLGLAAVAGGVIMIVEAYLLELHAKWAYHFIALILVSAGVVGALIHAAPMLLKRRERAWRLVHGILIGDAIVMGILVQPFVLIALFQVMCWSAPRVREFYGVAPKSEPGSAPMNRPRAVTLFWMYCSAMVLLGLYTLLLGIHVIVRGSESDYPQSEDRYIGGGIVALIGFAVALFHAVPPILTRNDTSWRVIYGFLIAYMVLCGLTIWPLIMFPVLLFRAWQRPIVKEYYGVVAETQLDHYRRRRRDWDDGWDDEWDRPRQ
jgi:hypothetical protein